jgi:hypothetical protein
MLVTPDLGERMPLVCRQADALDEWERQFDAMSTVLSAPQADPVLPRQPFPYLCVLDVEATCEEHGFHGYQHEIIEFPVVVVDLSDGGAVLGEFHS